LDLSGGQIRNIGVARFSEVNSLPTTPSSTDVYYHREDLFQFTGEKYRRILNFDSQHEVLNLDGDLTEVANPHSYYWTFTSAQSLEPGVVWNSTIDTQNRWIRERLEVPSGATLGNNVAIGHWWTSGLKSSPNYTTLSPSRPLYLDFDVIIDEVNYAAGTTGTWLRLAAVIACTIPAENMTKYVECDIWDSDRALAHESGDIADGGDVIYGGGDVWEYRIDSLPTSIWRHYRINIQDYWNRAWGLNGTILLESVYFVVEWEYGSCTVDLRFRNFMLHRGITENFKYTRADQLALGTRLTKKKEAKLQFPAEGNWDAVYVTDSLRIGPGNTPPTLWSFEAPNEFIFVNGTSTFSLTGNIVQIFNSDPNIRMINVGNNSTVNLYAWQDRTELVLPPQHTSFEISPSIGQEVISLRRSGDIVLDGTLMFDIATGDVNLYRAAANVLKTDDLLRVANILRVGTGSEGLLLKSTWDDNFTLITHTNTPNPNLVIGYGDGTGALDATLENIYLNDGVINLRQGHVKLTDGKELQWSDVNLYRSAANALKTDDTFECAGLTLNGDLDLNANYIIDLARIYGPASGRVYIYGPTSEVNSSVEILSTGAGAGKRTWLVLRSSDDILAGVFQFYTPNAAKTGDVERIRIGGVADIVDVDILDAYLDIVNQGLKIGGTEVLTSGRTLQNLSLPKW